MDIDLDCNLWTERKSKRDNKSLSTQSQHVSEEPQLSTQMQLVIGDFKSKHQIQRNVVTLSDNFKTMNDLCQGVYSLSRYIPEEVKLLPKWKDEILPAMKEALLTDVNIRNNFEKAIGNMRSISNTVRSGAELIQQTQGSSRAITIVIREIEKAFKVLDESKSRLGKLNLSILEKIKENTDDILDTIGDKNAKDLMDRKENISNEIKKNEQELEKIEEEKYDLIGKIQGLSNYIVALEEINKNKDAAIQEMQTRMKNIHDSIQENEKKKDEIPKHITISEGERGIFSFRTTFTIKEVQNPDRESELQFLKGLASSKLDTARQIEDAKERQETAKKALAKEISDIKVQINAQETKLKETFLSGPKFERKNLLMAYIKKDMNELKKVDEAMEKLESKFGMKGQVLCEFLIETRSFLERTHGQAVVVEPMIQLIENIQSRMKTHLQFLKGGTKSDVFIGGQGLLNALGMVDACTNVLPILALPQDEQTKAIISELRSDNLQAPKLLNI